MAGLGNHSRSSGYTRFWQVDVWQNLQRLCITPRHCVLAEVRLAMAYTSMLQVMLSCMAKRRTVYCVFQRMYDTLDGRSHCKQFTF